jgi:fused signal recognition particle receptor
MEKNLPIVVAVVVLALVAVYFLFLRKPATANLPPTAPKDKDQGKPAAAKPVAPSKDEAAKVSLPPASSKGQPSAPEALGSQDLLPASESQQAPAIPVETPAAATPVVATPVVSEPVPSKPVLSKKDVAGLRKGLAATRGGFMARLKALFVGKKEIDPAILEQIEEIMLTSDVGVKTTQAILERLRERLSKNELADTDAVWAALRMESARILTVDGGGLAKAPKGQPLVVLMVGVNGVGKTTTIGKLATKWTGDGKKVVLGAGDTFRAAAVAQLEVWGKRVGADVVKGKEGSDPGAVAFEATKKAVDAAFDILLVDTAGRLHTKVNLMDEIKKVKRTIGKALDGAPHETLLVLDATTGQNALNQATLFKEALDLTGIILTKLDGTAKGGVVLGVCDELKLPVRYIGLGERAEDLREFVAADFVEALFGRDDDVEAA